MPFSITQQIVLRAFLWIVLLASEFFAPVFFKFASHTYWYYVIAMLVTFAILMAISYIEEDALVRDMREICLYEILIYAIGFTMYKLAYNPTPLVTGLMNAIFFLKYGRLLWVNNIFSTNQFVAWPIFGILGLYSRLQLKNQTSTRPEEQASPKKVYFFIILCCLIGFTLPALGITLFIWQVGLVVFIATPFIAKHTLNEMKKQNLAYTQAIQASTSAERYAAAQEVRATMATQHAIEQDILLQQLAEKNAKLERINRALRDTAHDLRSPMASIQQETTKLLRASSQAERLHAGHLLENAVVDFSRALDETIKDAMLATGITQPQIRAVRIDRLLNKVHHEWCNTAIEQGFKAFNLYPIPGSRMMVATDARIILRILRNLVSNAIAHGRPNASLAISLRRHGDKCLVRVWDTGPGIADAEGKDRVENFRQLVRKVQTEGRNSNGHGLGLSIVSNLAEILNLRMELHSRLERGTVFGFSLNFADENLIAETQRLQAEEQVTLQQMLN